VSFAKGFKKKVSDKVDKTFRVNTAQYSTLQSENQQLYPSPNTSTNVSGSDKYAAAMGLAQGAKPARVTPQAGPYGAPMGAVGVTGTSVTKPFQNAMGKFGKKPRLGMKSITRLTRGM
jgi:hypothetical protein